MSKELPKNIFLHPNGKLWVKKTYKKKILRRSLHTNDLKLAKSRALEYIKDFKVAIDENIWAPVNQKAAKRSVATIREVLPLFKEFSALQGHAHSTTVTYTSKLRRVVSKMCPGNWQDASTEDLTPQLCNEFVEKWLMDRVEEIREDPRKRQDTVNMAQGELRNASAIFGRKARGFYRDRKLKLPPGIAEFGPSTRYDAKIKKYRVPATKLIDATLKAGHELKGEQWLAFAGCFELACRGSEWAHARVDWFVQDARKQWWLQVPEECTKRRDHRKRVPTALFDAIMAEVGERDTILPGETHLDRVNLIQRGAFTKWMRGLGWETNELAHELRKLKGCYVYHHYDGENSPLEAKKLLGHSTIATTENFYADNLGIPLELHHYFTTWETASEALSAGDESEKQA